MRSRCARWAASGNGFWLPVILFSFLAGTELWAQVPPGDAKPSASDAQQTTTAKKPEKETPKPAEKAPEKQPETLRLETPPETPAAPAEQKPTAPSTQPSATPTRTKPEGSQKLQLEAPTTGPTGPEEAPKGPKRTQPEAPKQAIIEDIIFRGNRRIPANTLRARIFSHKGDVYDENALERDFMALWNTGFLDDIRLEVADGDKGKILTFFVREKKLIRSIDYKGLSTVQQSDVLDEYKKRKVGLSIQSQFDPVVIKRAEVVLQDMLAAHGKMFATVRARTRNIPPNSVALTFIVVEGPKVKMGNVRFNGNTVFSDGRLVRAMKYSRPSGAPPWFYWFHKTYDRERIQADLENIRELYRENGYFFALAKEPTTKMVDTKHHWPFFLWSWGRGKRVDMSIPVEEGEQYRLGKFTIRGNKLFKQQQLAPILQLKSGDIFNLSKVRKSIENYTKLYGGFGYINFTAEPDIEPDRKRKIINLALDFVEDKQFFVHRIEFSGNTKTRDKVIRRELLVDEGNVFSSTMWDYSVLKMNQLGFFDQIKKEDYEIKQNTKDSTLDVVVKVKEKGRNSIGFSGGVSGLAGNFVGLNYATNNFLGLGETLSLQFQWGTYEKLYSFGFTEPYIFDRAITTGFTIFKSDYRYDQARYAAYYSGLNPNALGQSPYAQALFQNFEQNSAGFTVFASYPLRRSFARLGLTYSFTKSSMQAFSLASQAYFEAINFRGLVGPNALSGITQSQVMPTYLYNTVDSDWTPHRGKYIYAGLGFSGSILGGNVNTIRPILEFKYYHPINHQRNVLAMHVVASMVTGFGGLVSPPFSRFYIGGETDIRGFNIRSISPIAFFPTMGSVCNRDANGNKIWATDSHGNPLVGTCGSSTQFPYNTPIYPGGDTEVVTNLEYRIPIAGPVTLAYFVDLGMNPVLFPSQLKIDPNALSNIHNSFPNFPLPTQLNSISATNFRPHGSSGLELQVILPIVNAPVRVYYGYDFLRLNENVASPQGAALPSPSLFPNQATYIDALQFFQPFRLKEKKGMVGFTVARTF